MMIAAAAAPPRVFILPSTPTTSSTSTSSIITLPHPQTSAPTRYLLHPTSKTLTYEITKVSNPIATPRSWLFTTTTTSSATPSSNPGETSPPPPTITGQIIQDAHLYFTTPMDPL